MASEQGAEPSAWELMRGLERVERSINTLGGKVVSVDVYNADKVAAAERVQRVEARAAELEKGAVEGEKLKRNQRLTISLAIASPVVAAIVGWIATGGLIR